jgi:hypothetical protein
MRVEEETSTMTLGEKGQRSRNQNGSTNPNVETPAEPEGRIEKQQGKGTEEVLVEDITNQSDSKG